MSTKDKPEGVTDEMAIAACRTAWPGFDQFGTESKTQRISEMRAALEAALPSGVRDGEIERLRGKLFKAEDRHEAEHRSHIRTGEARDKWRERAKAAEARVAELEKALNEIAAPNGALNKRAWMIARAALKGADHEA